VIDPTASLPPPDGPDRDGTRPESAAMPPWVPRAIALAAAWVVVLFAARWALRELRVLVVMLLVALFLSLAMEPVVDRLARRGWRRGSATFAVLLGLLVVLGLLLVATGSVLVGEARDLADNAPVYVRELERFVNRDLGIDWNADTLVRDLRQDRSIVPSRDVARTALGVGATAATALLQAVTVLVFAFYMTADGPSLRRTICSRLPQRHQAVVLDTWELAIQKTGGYLFSRGIQALVSAVLTTAFLYLLGIPYALALGVWVGVISQFVPTVGTYIAMVLPVLIAFKEQPSSALWVTLFLVAYQQFENYVLGPRVTRQTMAVHPALAIGTVFAGGLLLGGAGAVLALPATGVIQAVVSSYTIEREVLESPLTDEPERRGWVARWRDRHRA
jgi:predicted PurR-regulated permease PerM